MDKKSIERVCKNIYRKYPMLNGKKPKVTLRGEDRYLLIFSGTGKTPDGKSITNTVRVVADENGRIVKTSMSR